LEVSRQNHAKLVHADPVVGTKGFFRGPQPAFRMEQRHHVDEIAVKGRAARILSLHEQRVELAARPERGLQGGNVDSSRPDLNCSKTGLFVNDVKRLAAPPGEDVVRDQGGLERFPSKAPGLRSECRRRNVNAGDLCARPGKCQRVE
jgi:hypothetical protein